MRVTFLLLTVMLVKVSAVETHAQNTKVTLTTNNSSIKEVLKEIEQQSDYTFFYNDMAIDMERRVRVNVKNKEIKDVLTNILPNCALEVDGKRIILIPLSQSVLQDKKTITGTVLDDRGEPVIGANVVEKGVTNGNITGIDGDFSISVAENATLQISYIGYLTQEIAIGSQSSLRIILRENLQVLDEIVVIGYGTVKKSDLTGAISQIDPTKEDARLAGNAAELLRNSVAGLNVPMSTNAKGGVDMKNVAIRGTTSLAASNTPLIVLDGMIYDGDLADISSHDIERIDIMKDASSAAIYGSRSSNGVIQITTKKGSSGAPSINFSANVGAFTTSSRRKVLSPEGYVNMRQELGKYTTNYNELYPGYYANPNELPSGVGLDTWLGYTGASAGDHTSEWLNRLLFNAIEIENYKAGRTTDWEDELFQVGLRQDYMASVTGGNERVRYYWSFNYQNNESFVVGDQFDAIRTRLNLENKITDFLSVGVNAQYSVRNEDGETVGWGSYQSQSPYGSIYEEDGETLRILPDGYNTSPLLNYHYNERNRLYRNLNSKLYALITLPFGITYQFNAINNFGDSNQTGHNPASRPDDTTNGYAFRDNSRTYYWSLENLLKWNKEFGAHRFDVTLMQNAEKNNYKQEKIEGRNFDPTDLLGYHNMAAASTVTTSSNDTEYTRTALMARLNYTLMDRYYLTAAVRRDGYSAFGKANPYATFPSVALSWKISDESFFNANKVNLLKLRFSVGANGNSAIDSYAALSRLGTGKHLQTGLDGSAYSASSLIINALANNDLKWEKTTAYNLGLDFGLFNNRLTGSFESYYSKTTNLLVNRALPSVAGLKNVYANLGQVDNKGIELTLNSINLDIPKTLTWRTNFNISWNKNEIVHLYGEYDENGKELDDSDNGWFIGQSLDVIWDYKPDGVWQVEDTELAAKYGFLPGEFRMVDTNNDGQLTSLDDKQFLGHKTPQVRWNIVNDFTLFRKISFSFTLYGMHGHKGNYVEKFGDNQRNDFVAKYWTPENRSNKYARMSERDIDSKIQTNYISKTFVRLSDISVGYIFPEKMLNTLHLKGLKVYGSVSNVACWDKWLGWDAENTGGPIPRTYNFGISVNL